MREVSLGAEPHASFCPGMHPDPSHPPPPPTASSICRKPPNRFRKLSLMLSALLTSHIRFRIIDCKSRKRWAPVFHTDFSLFHCRNWAKSGSHRNQIMALCTRMQRRIANCFISIHSCSSCIRRNRLVSRTLHYPAEWGGISDRGRRPHGLLPTRPNSMPILRSRPTP